MHAKGSASIAGVVAAVAVAVVTGTGCDAGAIKVTTTGQDVAIGLAADRFDDGVSVTFSRFAVVVSSLNVEGAGDLAQSAVFDVAQEGPHEIVTFSGLAAGAYDDVEVIVGPAADATVAGNVDADTVAAMADNELSVLVEGSIAIDNVDTTFSWGFDANTRYVGCTDVDGQEGVVVPDGKGVIWDITVHGDRVFQSDLSASSSPLRAASIVAADRNDDGAVDIDELGSVDLQDLDDGLYVTGRAAGVVTLADFVRAQTARMVFHTGDGPCTPEQR